MEIRDFQFGEPDGGMKCRWSNGGGRRVSVLGGDFQFRRKSSLQLKVVVFKLSPNSVRLVGQGLAKLNFSLHLVEFIPKMIQFLEAKFELGEIPIEHKIIVVMVNQL
uniref:(northern house mosquito) hypothetical protein n=1 Tax=Culex pipiens TaxID=7175 RepID=A0A8D8CIV4_CULPI